VVRISCAGTFAECVYDAIGAPKLASRRLLTACNGWCHTGVTDTPVYLVSHPDDGGMKASGCCIAMRWMDRVVALECRWKVWSEHRGAWMMTAMVDVDQRLLLGRCRC